MPQPDALFKANTAASRRFANIAIRRMTSLRGPGFWTYRPAVEAVVDIGELEDFPSNTLPGFYERLTTWLPGLIEHHCGIGERGGFLMRLRDGTWPGHIMEHVALELQTLAGMDTSFGKARMTHERGVYKVVIRAEHEAIGRLALTAARDLVMAAINDTPCDVAAITRRLRSMADQLCLGPSTASIVEAARQRGIPAIRLTDGNLVQLGHGIAQRRIWTAETDRTSAIAEGITHEPELMRELLTGVGIPVPELHVVASAAKAKLAAEAIGLPVTVRHRNASISPPLASTELVAQAFALACADDEEVLVDAFAPGHLHRLLVVGGHLVAALKHEPTVITGDGKSSASELLAAVTNNRPDRNVHSLQLALQIQGLTNGDVLPKGQSVIVERVGATTVNVTSLVHPEVAAQALLATRVIRLDIAGVDIVAENIGKPLATQDGAILRVWAGPDLQPHLKPVVGDPEPVDQIMVDHMFPAAESGRIPIVGILGDGHSALAARLIATMLRLRGWHTGLACRDGLFLGERRMTSHGSLGFDAGESLLMNRTVQAAVLGTSPRHILTEGLPYDRCQVGIVLNMPGPEGLSDLYINEAEQMPSVVRTQVDVVLPNGAAALNADDEAVLALAQYCDGEVVLFSTQADSPALAAHRAAQGRAVLAKGSTIILMDGARETPLIHLSPTVAAASPEDGLHDARPHVLAAVAAAWVLGLTPDLIRAGLLHFEEPGYVDSTQ